LARAPEFPERGLHLEEVEPLDEARPITGAGKEATPQRLIPSCAFERGLLLAGFVEAFLPLDRDDG